jgi:hypothetical protein
MNHIVRAIGRPFRSLRRSETPRNPSLIEPVIAGSSPHAGASWADQPPEALDGQARIHLVVSDYDLMVELAAKGMAERDNHPMPKSVTTPREFYEVMARAALDAAGLQALLEDLARAEPALKEADEGPTHPVKADAATMHLEQPSAAAACNGHRNVELDTQNQIDQTMSKADKARLRREWVITAEDKLAVVTDAVKRLRKVFNIAWEAPEEVASEVVTGCDGIVGWLNNTRAPRGLGKADAELGAAAGVYRNAAIVHLSLENADAYRRSARSNAYTRLLEQGDYHVEAFVVALAKKFGDDHGFERRSTGESRKSGGAVPFEGVPAFNDQAP